MIEYSSAFLCVHLRLIIRCPCGFPLHEFQVEHEDRIDHRHEQQRDKGRCRETADLRVTERLPERPPVQREREQSDHGCGGRFQRSGRRTYVRDSRRSIRAGYYAREQRGDPAEDHART